MDEDEFTGLMNAQRDRAREARKCQRLGHDTMELTAGVQLNLWAIRP